MKVEGLRSTNSAKAKKPPDTKGRHVGYKAQVVKQVGEGEIGLATGLVLKRQI